MEEYSQTVSTFTYSMSYIFGKLLFQRLILAINKDFLSVLQRVRILLTHCNRIEHKIWHLVVYLYIVQYTMHKIMKPTPSTTARQPESGPLRK